MASCIGSFIPKFNPNLISILVLKLRMQKKRKTNSEHLQGFKICWLPLNTVYGYLNDESTISK